MGLRKRGDVWYLRKKVAGKRVEVSTGHTDLQLARKRAAQLTNQMVNEEQGLAAREVPTFGAWWVVYEANYVTGKAATTQRRDRGIITPWLALWGSTRLDRIKQADCLAGLRSRRVAMTANPKRNTQTTLSEGTVQRERRLLQAVFERAVENDHLEKNPWKGIEGARDTVRVRLLTAEAEGRLRAALASPAGNAGNVKRAKPEQWLRFLTFMLETGVRLDECLSLDPSMPQHATYVRVLGKGSKWREVPLTARAQAALDQQRAAEGKLWTQNPQRVRAVLARACARAGIAHLSPHDLRHTFGHRYLQRGGRIHTLSKILGHAGISVTEKHYAHLLKEDIANEMLAVMSATP